jgi:myo-inositol-1(or 4)-monophosphatase
MPAPDWSDLTKLALAIADAAAEEILPHFRKDSAVDNKSDDAFDPVTEGDRAGERAMRALIEEHFPDHGIIGEEFGEKDSKSGFTWVLDPIDGTRAFICGMPTWATLVGLNYEGKPVVGVMNQPWVGEVFFGNPLGSWARRRARSANACSPLRRPSFTSPNRKPPCCASWAPPPA